MAIAHPAATRDRLSGRPKFRCPSRKREGCLEGGRKREGCLEGGRKREGLARAEGEWGGATWLPSRLREGLGVGRAVCGRGWGFLVQAGWALSPDWGGASVLQFQDQRRAAWHIR